MSDDLLMKIIDKHETTLIEIQKENAIQSEELKDIKEKLDKLLKAFNIGEGAVHSVKLLGKFTVWIAGICSAVYGLYLLIMDNIMK